MPKARAPKVLVVGAGPVGLTMAAELRRLGIAARLIERAADRSPGSKALVVWQRTLEQLDPLGVSDSILAHGAPARRIRVLGDTRELLAIRLAMNDCLYREPVLIPQGEVETALEAALGRQGGRIERGCALIDFADRGDKVDAMIQRADGSVEHVAVDWLVGCDGADSLVRQRLGIAFATAPAARRWVMGDVVIDNKTEADEAQFHWHRRGYLALVPIRQGRWRIVVDGGAIADDGRQPPEPTLEELQRAIGERGLPHHISDPTWLTAMVVREARVDRYYKGRVLLAGDAAHVHGPVGSQGMNAGLQDALNLAWKLDLACRGGDADLLLDSYTHERSAVADYVLAISRRLLRVSGMRNRLLRATRNGAVRLLGRTGKFRQRIARRFSALGTAYRDSPLNLDPQGIPRGALRPGERLPESMLRRADGNPMPLAELFRAGRPWLLALVGDRMPEGLGTLVAIDGLDVEVAWVGATQLPGRTDGVALSDPDGGLYRAAGAAGDATRLLLVRPDRHVMANVAANRAADLTKLARRVFATGH
jgi:2-polyprenyl-6-methoxyphenol hydroxylase-like FAD-dependent oxidoreductase